MTLSLCVARFLVGRGRSIFQLVTFIRRMGADFPDHATKAALMMILWVAI